MFGVKGTMKSILMVAISCVLLLLSVGCGGISEEQIQAMEEKRSAALAAEQKVDDLKSQKSQLESTLSSKQADVEQAKQDKADVESRAENWGNE